jgi:hypothetical protein
MSKMLPDYEIAYDDFRPSGRHALVELGAKVKDQNGFLTDADVEILAGHNRLCQVLVRCGSCRFVCAAQDVKHLVGAVEAVGDYVRDVSLPRNVYVEDVV